MLGVGEKLEVELRGKLRLTGGGSTGNLTEPTGIKGRVRIAELGVVEDVVALHTDLELAEAVRRQVEVLREDQVGAIQAGTMVRITVNVAEGTDRLLGEVGLGTRLFR